MAYTLPQPAAPVFPMATPERGLPVPEASSPAPFVIEPAVTATGRPKPTRKKKSNYVPLMIGGGLAVAVLIIGVGMLMFAGGGNTQSQANQGKNAKKGKAAPTGTLVLDWPEDERRNASMLIDGKGATIPSKGPIELKLRPGKHVVGIMRRDYEPVRAEITISQANAETFRPDWKEAPKIAAPAAATPAANTINTDGGTDFKVGSAIVPRGFEGWQQLLPVAKEKAAAERKDLLIVLGSSDGNPDTARLADALRAAGLPGGALGERFVPVVVDLPQTAEGLNMLVDRMHNRDVAQDYRPESLPLLALADAQGRPYAVQREWPDGVSDAAKIVETLRTKRADRDKLLDATTQGDEAQQLDAAVATLRWIFENKVVVQYRDDIHRWFELAQKGDPQNAGGKLEVALEAELTCQLRDLFQSNDAVLISRKLDLLQPWLKERKFTDEDRGFKLHLLTGSILGQLGDERLAMAHLERAATYSPKDSDLKEKHREIQLALSQDPNILSSGTGFVVAEGGYVLTNRHVVDGTGRVVVRVGGVKEPVPAQVIKIHDERDMALLKVEFPESFNPPPVTVASDKLNRGLEVAAFGYPQGDQLGQELKFTRGAISGLPNPALENMILLDLRVNPGNSGGPLCNGRGQVIGMITAKTGGVNLDSYGMALPANELVEFLNEHLPADAKRGEADAAEGLDSWDKVDAALSPAVLMILKVR
jgi:S1-C subfamily serine protease